MTTTYNYQVWCDICGDKKTCEHKGELCKKHCIFCNK